MKTPKFEIGDATTTNATTEAACIIRKQSFGILLVGILAITSLACQKQQTAEGLQAGQNNQGIIGGQLVAENDEIAKTTVGIFDVEGLSSCTGTIIAEDLVMTAAHCLGTGKLILAFDRNFDEIVNILMRGTEAQFQAIKPKLRGPNNAAMHPNYLELNRKLVALEERLRRGEEVTQEEINEVIEAPDQGDMLVLKFEGGLPAGYKPAQLLARTEQLTAGQEVVLAGYGWTDGVGRTGDDKLRKVNVSIDAPAHGTFEVIMNQQSGRGACHGDSGGPAFVIKAGVAYAFGVTSRGHKDSADDCSQFAIYSNMVAASDWLEAAKEEARQPDLPPIDEVQPADDNTLGGNVLVKGALKANLISHRGNVVLVPLRSVNLNRH